MMSNANFASDNSQKFSHLSEEQQFNEVCILLKQDIVAGLKVANSTVRDKKYFQELLEKGLESANVSEIETWLKYLIPRLGLRYIINVLETKILSQPEQVEKTLYWLPKFFKGASERELTLFKNLEKQMLGKEYKAVNPSGKAYKLVLKIKETNEYVIFGGYQLGSHGSGIIVEILDSKTLYPTGGVKLVSPSALEILDPQPYKD